MSREKIEEDLSEYIAALTGTDVAIEDKVTLTELDVDSISLVKIFVFIEKRFGISLLDAGISKDQIETFGSLVQYINRTVDNH